MKVRLFCFYPECTQNNLNHVIQPALCMDQVAKQLNFLLVHIAFGQKNDAIFFLNGVINALMTSQSADLNDVIVDLKDVTADLENG